MWHEIGCGMRRRKEADEEPADGKKWRGCEGRIGGVRREIGWGGGMISRRGRGLESGRDEGGRMRRGGRGGRRRWGEGFCLTLSRWFPISDKNGI